MAILRYIMPILSVFLLTGCYEDFNPEIDTKPVLCLNSLITAGEPIEVKVTHTWMFNDEKSERNHDVKDAVVTILVNERIVGSDYLPKEGDKIRIVAESPTYGTATAEVVVPYATPIEKVRVSPVVKNIWKGEDDFFHYEMFADITFNLNVEMDVNDPAGPDNYYHFGYNGLGQIQTVRRHYQSDNSSIIQSRYSKNISEYSRPLWAMTRIRNLYFFPTVSSREKLIRFISISQITPFM